MYTHQQSPKAKSFANLDLDVTPINLIQGEL